MSQIWGTYRCRRAIPTSTNAHMGQLYPVPCRPQPAESGERDHLGLHMPRSRRRGSSVRRMGHTCRIAARRHGTVACRPMPPTSYPEDSSCPAAVSPLTPSPEAHHPPRVISAAANRPARNQLDTTTLGRMKAERPCGGSPAGMPSPEDTFSSTGGGSDKTDAFPRGSGTSQEQHATMPP